MPLKPVARFSISYLQILDEKGKLDEKLEPQLSPDELKKLYWWMCLAREADQRMHKLQRQGRTGTFPLSTGQEATVCGATFAMTDRDWYVGAYRDLGGRLMRGEPFSRYCLYWNGHEEGNVNPAGGRTLPTSVIIGAQTLHAVGIAYAMRYRGETDSAVVTFCGEGATSEGDFHEALNFAAVWAAPVVFICQNNQWAISVPREKQTHSRTIAQKAVAYDIPGLQVDGNDVLAVYKATKEALERARAGGGPTFIEAITYRLLMHTTADDPSKYRSKTEEEEWWKRDPIPRFRRYLETKGVWNDELQAGLETEVEETVNAGVQEFEAMHGFKPDAPFDHVFGTRHDRTEAQRAEFLENLRREAADA
ncbi:MAG: pyruvate dehydrogenase (acetyl-transferring) E1 component subunit alpha [Planctomycetota bacterium]